MAIRTVGIIQARMTSNRLPGKVIKPLAGAPLILRMLDRVKRIHGLDDICLAVPHGSDHESLVRLAPEYVEVFRGDEQNVLKRTHDAARHMKADVIIRITSDCPLIDPAVSSTVLSGFLHSNVSYARTAINSGFPHGFDTEVFSMAALDSANSEARTAYDREHVTPFIWQRPERFRAVELGYWPDRRFWRLTVDTQEDYDLVSQVYNRLYPKNPVFGFSDLEELFRTEPNLLQINRKYAQDNTSAYQEYQHEQR